MCTASARRMRCREMFSPLPHVSIRQDTPAYVSIRQHTSAYVSIRQHTSAYVSIRQHTSTYASIRQHTPAYVSIRQHTSACALLAHAPCVADRYFRHCLCAASVFVLLCHNRQPERIYISTACAQRQYLCFCAFTGSKASAVKQVSVGYLRYLCHCSGGYLLYLRRCSGGYLRTHRVLLRQYLYFCTSKASKLSTFRATCLDDGSQALSY
jgi:hypothetical protein